MKINFIIILLFIVFVASNNAMAAGNFLYAAKKIGIHLKNGQDFEQAYIAVRNKLNDAINPNINKACENNPKLEVAGRIDRILELIATRIVLAESGDVDFCKYHNENNSMKSFEDIFKLNSAFGFVLLSLIVNYQKLLIKDKKNVLRFAVVNLFISPEEYSYVKNGKNESDSEKENIDDILGFFIYAINAKQEMANEVMNLIGEEESRKNLESFEQEGPMADLL